MWILIRMYSRKIGWVHKKSAYRYAIKYRKMNVRYMRESSSYQLHYTDSVDKKLFKYVNDFIKNDMNIKKAINQKVITGIAEDKTQLVVIKRFLNVSGGG